MPATPYEQRRAELQTYFDRTAAQNWIRLSSDAAVGRVREKVRQGRARMRRTLLGWLPEDLSGRRVLDAGCGTGLLAFEAARRGAQVTAVDLSAALVGHAREQLPDDIDPCAIDFRVGDLLEAVGEKFDHLVAMDSLIHYPPPIMADMVGRLANCARVSVLFTFVPRTGPLAVAHALGRLFPRRNRAPDVEPVARRRMRALLDGEPRLAAWRPARHERVQIGFYASEAVELSRA